MAGYQCYEFGAFSIIFNVFCFRQKDPKRHCKKANDCWHSFQNGPGIKSRLQTSQNQLESDHWKRVQTPGRFASKAGSLAEGLRPLQNFHHIVALLIQIHDPIRFKVFQKWDFLNHFWHPLAIWRKNVKKKRRSQEQRTRKELWPTGIDDVIRSSGKEPATAPAKSRVNSTKEKLQQITSNQSTKQSHRPSDHWKESLIRRPESAWLAKYLMQNPSALEKSRFSNPRSKQSVYGCQIQNGGRTNPKSKIRKSMKIRNPIKSKIQTAVWTFLDGQNRMSMIFRAPSGRKHRN